MVFGSPEVSGAWLIYGAEKNGKTWFALMLANYFTNHAKVLYISGEEGTGKDFTEACKRAGLEATNTKIKATGYVELDELQKRLDERRSAKVIVLDNITVYNEAFKYGKFKKLIGDNPDKIFIFLAHEENGEPYTSTAKMCRRLAKIIVHVEGLVAQVSGRCPGGTINIDEEKAQLYWGVKIK